MSTRWLIACVINIALLAALAGCDSAPPAIARVTSEPPAKVASESSAAAVAGPRPKAVAPQTEHDFGAMDCEATGRHTFSISNEGELPLTLRVSEISCKCTEVQLSSRELMPGESASVELDWKSESEPQAFHQWVRVQTNDPERKEIAFHIRGLVRHDVRIEPAELKFGDLLPPQTSQTIEAVVVSDHIDTLSLDDIKLSNERFELDAKPLSEQQRTELKVASGFRVAITAPDDLASGFFSETLQLQVRLRDGQAPRSIAVPITGRVRGRISVFGEKIDEHGCVRFGTLRYGEGGRVVLRLKVRDVMPQLNVTDLRVTPSFLKVKLAPVTRANLSGSYELTIEIPEDTEPCTHRVQDAGRIHFAFDHPRVKKLDLEVDFSVRPPPEIPVSR